MTEPLSHSNPAASSGPPDPQAAPLASPPSGSLLDILLHQAPEALPILRQSCIQVLNLTSDQRSNASDVGEVIMRDQALMANIIRIANSPAYHTRTPVKTPTHAVAIIGFDVIRAIVVASQLVEQAEEYGADSECLKRLLARSLVAATQALEMGKAIQYPDMGFLFTNTMLYTLGDLILAFCRPDLAERLEREQITNPTGLAKTEVELLGRPLRALAAAVAKRWRLPDSLIQLLERQPIVPQRRYETQQQILEGIVYTANQLSACLLNPYAMERDQTFRELSVKYLPALSLAPQRLTEVCVKAFTKACQFADLVRIQSTYFLPETEAPISSGKSPLQKLADAILSAIQPALRQRSRPEAAPRSKNQNEPTHSSRNDSPPSGPQEARPSAVSVAEMQEFTLKALAIQDPNALLNLAAESLQKTYGFERVVLVLVSPAQGILEARAGFGDHLEALFPFLRCDLHDDHLFTRTLREFQPSKILSLKPWAETGRLPSEFLHQWGEGPCLIGPLFSPINPIGVLLADHGNQHRGITDLDFTIFSLILSQTNTNLARLAQSASRKSKKVKV